MNFINGTTEHSINKSNRRKLLVSVWDFGAVHPQSERSHYLYNDHPAKMRPCLARAILQIYGESPVLDPMAGIGTTLVEAMLLGMDAVGVEYEQKFVDQANRNIRHVQKLFPDKKLGKAVCIKGDARDLSCLNNPKVNSIVFSPPYFDAVKSVSPGHQGPEDGHLERQHRLAKQKKSGYGGRDNIGHLNGYGTIIFSPPYFNAIKRGDEGPYASNERISYPERINRFQGYSANPENIGNIGSYGFGSIVFSPPYCGVMDAKRHVGGISARDSSLAKTGSYSENESNLGNIRTYGEFGSIIFSPPLGEANRGSGIAKEGYKGKYGKDEKLKDRCDRPVSKDKNNLSNVRFDKTYLSEMFKVYSECFRALKPGKFMVVVVKDIRRKGLTIPLGADTIKLCQLAGFEVFDIIINKMYFPSFWQLNHARKTQAKGIPMTLRTHEYVLVFRKVVSIKSK